MTIDFCDLCNENCLKGSIGFKNQEENWRLLVAQAICGLAATVAEIAISIANLALDLTPGFLISAATINATVIKASAGTLGFITASNVNASPRYLKVYDKATAPVPGTDAALLKLVFLIPGNTTGTGTNIPVPTEGIKFLNGISFVLTTGVAPTDTGAVAANEIVVNYGYA